MADDAPSQQDIQRLTGSLDRLSNRLDVLPDRIAAIYVTKETFNGAQDLHQLKHASQDEKIGSLLSAKEWIVRLVGSAIILALLGVVLIQR